MTNNGFIYVLINPSMPNLVKIGRTSRDPEDRIKELSSPTGIPTPFILAYDAYFEDCVEAEGSIHTLLEDQGNRLSKSREFFNAPLNKIIKIIIQVQNALSCSNHETRNHNTLFDKDYFQGVLQENLTFSSSSNWESVFKQAQEFHYGLGDTLQDDKEALRLYKKAAQLGAVLAYREIGEMYKLGDGCREDDDQALKYFRQGAEKGDDRCWAEMAILFTYINTENAKKCWNKFFHSKCFLEDLHNDSFNNRIHYAFEYMINFEKKTELGNFENQVAILKYELFDYATNKIPQMGLDFYDNYKRVIRMIKNLRIPNGIHDFKHSHQCLKCGATENAANHFKWKCTK